MVGVVDGLTSVSLAFGHWTLQGDGRLTGDGSDIQLPPKEWHVLRLLLASAGVLVTKDHLLELVWPHGEVAEESLTRCIYSLRKHLKDNKGFITTVYGKGYRFSCPVVMVDVPGQTRAGPGIAIYVCSACGQESNWGGLT